MPLTAVRALLTRLRTAAASFEQKHLDPLFDQALDLWAGGDTRHRQQMLVSAQSNSDLTPEERVLNRGLYISVGALVMSVAGNLFLPPLRLLSLAGLLYNSRFIYMKAYHDLIQHRHVSIDVLTALLNTAYLGGGLWFWGSLAQMSFFFSFRLRTVIEDRFVQDMTAAFSLQNQLVWQWIDGQAVQVSLEAIQVNDVVVVQAGEVIPVDGVVKEGNGLVDQQVLTGEARPVEKVAGDDVRAMTLVLSGRLFVAVTQTGQETTVAHIGRMLQESKDQRNSQQLQTFILTDRLVLPVLAGSALSLPWFGPLRAAALVDVHPQRHLVNLGLLSNISFLLYATQNQILIKDGRSLEIVGQVDTLIFDKTGTLTQPQPQVTNVHLCAECDTVDLLRYAAAAEQYQSHPIARALLAEAAAANLDLPEVADAAYRVGFGITVQIDGHLVHVGSARFIEQEEVAIPAPIRRVQEVCRAAGHSLVFVAVDRRLYGAVELQIQARDEAAEVIAALRRQGQIRHVVLVSGDQASPTAAVARELGIDEYVAEALPSDKAALIARLQASGRTVCFVGDGINDAVALKQADLSVSLYGATTAATQTAHVVLMHNDLRQLLSLFKLADEYTENQRQLMATVLVPSMVGAFGIFFLGFGLPQMTFLDLVQSSVGPFIAMRPWLRYRSLLHSSAQLPNLSSSRIVR